MVLYSKDVYPLRIHYHDIQETVIVHSEEEINKNRRYTILEQVKPEDIPISAEKPDA